MMTTKQNRTTELSKIIDRTDKTKETYLEIYYRLDVWKSPNPSQEEEVTGGDEV